MAESGRELCRVLDWDSEFFGLKIGRVVPGRMSEAEMQEALAWAGCEGVRCLYFLCAPDADGSVRAAESHGFHLVDVRIVFERAMGDEVSAATLARAVTPADVPTLQGIAADAYRDSRFWFDVNFDRERVAAFYSEWIARSCQGYADQVLVLDLGGEPAGFVTCHVEGTLGRIGLVGVAPQARGRGLGPALLDAALAYFSARGTRRVEVATQGRNLAAQRLYQRSGFVTSSAGLWYHAWL